MQSFAWQASSPQPFPAASSRRPLVLWIELLGRDACDSRAEISASHMKLTNDDLSTLYGRHSREIFRYLKRETGDSQAAIDLVGETFAQAVKGRRKFRGESLNEARAWLFGIARNLAHGFQKKQRIERNTMIRLGLERAEIEIDDDELTPEEASALVEESLSRVKDEYREAIRLRYLEGQSYATLADSLGVSEDVARARVSRGIRRMRQLAEEAPGAEEQA